MTQKVLGAGKMVMRSKAGNAGVEIVGKMFKDLAKKEVKATAKRQDGGKGSVSKYKQIVRGMQSSPGFEAELLKTAQPTIGRQPNTGQPPSNPPSNGQPQSARVKVHVHRHRHHLADGSVVVEETVTKSPADKPKPSPKPGTTHV